MRLALSSIMLVLWLAASQSAMAAAGAVDITLTGYPADSTPNMTVSGHADADTITVQYDLGNGGTSDDRVTISSPHGVQILAGAVANCPTVAATSVTCNLTALDPTIIVEGVDGDDTLTVSGTAHATYSIDVRAGAGNDTLTGGPGDETLTGGDGNDTIRDGLGRDTVRGGAGNDTLTQSDYGAALASSDTDSIDLGTGTDSVSYSIRAASRPVSIKPGSSSGSGGVGENDGLVGIETFEATNGNDEFFASTETAAVRLVAHGGDDLFHAGGVSETFEGGSGLDEVSWSGAGTGVFATPGDGANDGARTSADSDDLRADVERVTGSAFADNLTVAAGASCRISGGGSGDRITAPAGGCLLEGGDGPDTIIGSESGDVIEGGDGADVISAGAGDDVIRPGAGSSGVAEQVTFGAGNDSVEWNTAPRGGGATVAGVDVSLQPGATSWCGGLGIGTTAVRKLVAGSSQLEIWNDVPEVLTATDYGDTLCAGAAGSTLDGRGGDDTLFGGAANDVLIGGPGVDILNGQAGADQLFGGPGNDQLNGGAGVDVVHGDDGDDTVRGGGGSDSLFGDAGNDTLVETPFSTIMAGQSGIELDAGDRLFGGPGIDTIDGASGDDSIICDADMIGDIITDSGDGIETIDCSALGAPISIVVGVGIDGVIGTQFNDTIIGAAIAEGRGGDDVLVAAATGSTLDGGDGQDTVQGSFGIDTLHGGTGNDVVRGGDANDLLFGDSGIDNLDGEGGDDVLDGGGLGDIMAGGPGSDTVSYEARASGVVVRMDDAAGDGEPGEGDTVRPDIELLIGSSFNDELQSGNAPTTLQGMGGNDLLIGGSGADTLDGGIGNDTMQGRLGVDKYIPGPGLDAVSYADRPASAPVTVTIGAGTSDDGQKGEKEDVPASINVVIGGRGNDRLTGSKRAERLYGGPGNDQLDGGLGADLLSGGPGTDTVTYASRKVRVVVTVGAGKNDGQSKERDDVRSDVETVRGGKGNDVLTGTKGRQTLRGGPGNDTLTGGPGSDRLYGDSGNDFLRARDGVRKEIVDGGPGRDRAQFDLPKKVKKKMLPGDTLRRVERRLR